MRNETILKACIVVLGILLDALFITILLNFPLNDFLAIMLSIIIVLLTMSVVYLIKYLSNK